MKHIKFAHLFATVLILLLSRCKPEQVILSGGVTGFVTDKSMNTPVGNATVKLSPLPDSAITSSDGRFDFIHIEQGQYQLQVTKSAYSKYLKTIFVTPAKASEANVLLNESPVLKLSDHYLDFGFDTIGSLTISNGGTWKFRYNITSSQSWVKVHPSAGEINENTDTIAISIDRTGLSRDKHKVSIIISSAVGDQSVQDTIFIYVNGLVDSRDMKFYGIVKIGTQIWMSENLNIGKMVTQGTDQTGSQIIEKYCYDDDPVSCNIFGGMYQWRSAMQNAPADSGIIGTTRGICPAGWHIPTLKEWDVLINYSGGIDNASNSLRETGVSYWDSPNDGATNILGFSALPAGYYLAIDLLGNGFYGDGDGATFWSATITSHQYWQEQDNPTRPLISYYFYEFGTYGQDWTTNDAISVRCIKDPETKIK
jgi:uncharacterized protein (TIGR02145 family)